MFFINNLCIIVYSFIIILNGIRRYYNSTPAPFTLTLDTIRLYISDYTRNRANVPICIILSIAGPEFVRLDSGLRIFTFEDNCQLAQYCNKSIITNYYADGPAAASTAFITRVNYSIRPTCQFRKRTVIVSCYLSASRSYADVYLLYTRAHNCKKKKKNPMKIARAHMILPYH